MATNLIFVVILNLFFLATYTLAHLVPNYGNHGSHYLRSPKTSNIFDYKDVDIFVELSDQQEWPSHSDQIDFGFGFATYLPPKHLMEALAMVSTNYSEPAIHQYARDKGDLRLVKAISALYSRWMNRQIDPMKEILVTCGAFQALQLAARSYLNPGDEVIVFEPHYMQYPNIIKLAGGVPVTCQLKQRSSAKPITSGDLTFDIHELESKFSNRTKMIWINNPSNPTGHVFTVAELNSILSLCQKYDVLILADEVAQFYNFEGPPYTRIASLPGFWPRTITVNSGGKTFSNTGWRVGWAIGPPELLWAMNVALVSSILAVDTPIQMAFAIAIEHEIKRLNTPDSYFEQTKKNGHAKRDRLVNILLNAGLDVVRPEGGYFVMANFTNVIHKIDLSKETENRPGCKLNFWLYKNIKLLTTPGYLFYSQPNKPAAEYCLRFCILKDDQTFDRLETALNELLK